MSLFEFQSFSKGGVLRDLMATGMTEFKSKSIRNRRSQIEAAIGRQMDKNRGAADRSTSRVRERDSLLDKLAKMNLLRTQQ